MTAPKRLGDDEVRTRLQRLPAWRLDAGPNGGQLLRELRFAGFGEAFAFMTRVALLAEKHGHHPDWHNVYDRVTIRRTTHDVGGISDRDCARAAAIDAATAARTP